jgi:hypothetical protein
MEKIFADELIISGIAAKNRPAKEHKEIIEV